MKYLTITIISTVLLMALFSIKDKHNLYITPQFENSVLKKIETDSNVTELWEFRGEKNHILLINGGPGVPNYLYPIAKHLNDIGYKVVLYNQRGTGNSINQDGDFALASYVEDIEKIRKELNIKAFHLYGHSWGGLLSQLYFSTYPENVKSLFLSNSAIGTGSEWQTMEKKVMRYNQKQSTMLNWIKLGGLSGTSLIPGNIGDSSSRSMMNLVWKNYFESPKNVEDADQNWLNGIYSTTINETRKALINTEAFKFEHETTIPITILYGERDIYGEDYDIIFNRFNHSNNVILSNSGHLPWIQNKSAYFDILSNFYENGTNHD